MALEHLKQEIIKEMEAVKKFIELAISTQQAGYTKAAHFFLSEAKEDCDHAFLYARELDKYNTSNSIKDSQNIVEITKDYYNLEYGAIDRIGEMYKDAQKEEMHRVLPFLSDMMMKHSEDCYRAKKLLQKIEILFSSDALSDIEDLFEESEESE